MLWIWGSFFGLFELKRTLKKLLSFLNLLLVVPGWHSFVVLCVLWVFAWLFFILGKRVSP